MSKVQMLSNDVENVMKIAKSGLTIIVSEDSNNFHETNEGHFYRFFYRFIHLFFFFICYKFITNFEYCM